MNYYVTKYFSYANMKLEFIPKIIIKEVTMSAVKITIITTYEVIKRRETRGRLSPSDRFITCG